MKLSEAEFVDDVTIRVDNTESEVIVELAYGDNKAYLVALSPQQARALATSIYLQANLLDGGMNRVGN